MHVWLVSIYFCSDRKKYNPFSRFARKVLVLYMYLLISMALLLIR